MNVNASVHEFLSILNVGEKTLASYQSALTKLTIYLARNNVDDVRPEDINRFRQYMIDRKYKEKQIRNTIGVCKRWYDWAYCDEDPKTESEPVIRKPSPIYCECGRLRLRRREADLFVLNAKVCRKLLQSELIIV